MNNQKAPSKNPMLKRTIMIFPRFSKRSRTILQKIRRDFDPLWDKVAPHITLVFPFESSLSKDEIAKIIKESLSGVSRFCIRVSSFERFDTGHVYLKIVDGEECLLTIIRDFYDSEVLSKYRPNFYDVLKPHITVAFFNDKAQMDAAFPIIQQWNVEEEIRIKEIAVEIIGADEFSQIEYRYRLK